MIRVILILLFPVCLWSQEGLIEQRIAKWDKNITMGKKTFDEYEFVKFEHQHTEIEDAEEWKVVAESLRAFLRKCVFIVGDYGFMWKSEDIEIKERYRGPSLHFNGEYTWWYNISGGYVLNTK